MPRKTEIERYYDRLTRALLSRVEHPVDRNALRDACASGLMFLHQHGDGRVLVALRNLRNVEDEEWFDDNDVGIAKRRLAYYIRALGCGQHIDYTRSLNDFIAQARRVRATAIRAYNKTRRKKG